MHRGGINRSDLISLHYTLVYQELCEEVCEKYIYDLYSSIWIH